MVRTLVLGCESSCHVALDPSGKHGPAAHRAQVPVPGMATGSGVAVVAYNQRCLRSFQEDFSGKNERSRPAQASARRYSH